MAGRKKPYVSSKGLVYDKMTSAEHMNVERKKKKNKKKPPKSASDGAKDENVPPTPTGTTGGGAPFRNNQKRGTPYFKLYMPEDKVLQGIRRGELIKGVLRINQRNSQEAYIDSTASDGFPDYMVLGVRDRNRALNGDQVVIKPKTRDNWVLRTSVFRHWKQANDIGNHFEMSLNHELYDTLSIDSSSTEAEEEVKRKDDEQESDLADRLLLSTSMAEGGGDEAVAGDGTPAAAKSKKKRNKKAETNGCSSDNDEEEELYSSFSDCVSSDDFETAAEEEAAEMEELDGDDEASTMIRLAMAKLDEKRALEKANLAAAPKPKTYKYDRKRILRYRRRVPADYCPPIEDEVKSLIMKVLASKTPTKRFPFQFVGNFNKNDEIPNFLLIRTCEVVFISEKKLYGSSPFIDCAVDGRARAAGHLAPLSDEMLLILTDHYLRHAPVGSGNRRQTSPLSASAVFTPSDSRLPKMIISPDQLPADFVKRPQDFSHCIFVAEMLEDWSADTSLARGNLLRRLGDFGDVRAETEALLLTNNIDTRPFSREVLAELEEHFPTAKKLSATGSKSSDSVPPKRTRKPKNLDNVETAAEFEAKFLEHCKASAFKIKRKVLESRKDYRFTTVFTIDPTSARDLDDALHIQRSTTADGRACWEVGVHIADVSYFVQPGSKVDTWARRRGTSVYLVDEVIPMLPRVLCEELCSLNPNEDRLTFSVVWKMDDEGHILEEWFGRSVIRSCVKLAYEHAQSFIDNPEVEWSLVDLPPIYYTNRRQAVEEDGEKAQVRLTAIRDCVLQLNRIASAIRRRRFDGGALRLDAPKLKIRFSGAGHKYPCGVCLDERSDANFLVEEFMLMANMAVALRIADEFPDVALLRRHPPPKTSALEDAVKKCEQIGFPLGAATSSKEISEALRGYESQPELRRTVLPILFQYMLRSMQLAVYFCSGVVKSEIDYRHFALNVDRYTHFTSPIRRYPDLVVHRLLSACLGYRKKPTFTSEQVEAVAKHCNQMKVAAKVVSDGSAEIFFNAFIKEIGSFEAYGIVKMVHENILEVMLLEFGIVEIIAFRKMKEIKSVVYQRAPDSGKNEKSRGGSVRLTFYVKLAADDKSVIEPNKPAGKRTRARKTKSRESAVAANDADTIATNDEDTAAITDDLASATIEDVDDGADRKETSNEKEKVDEPAEREEEDVKEKTEPIEKEEEEADRKTANEKDEPTLKTAVEFRSRPESSAIAAGKKKVKKPIEQSTFEMTINMLSIVKVAMMPDEDRPGKHFTTLVATPETANLTVSNLDKVFDAGRRCYEKKIKGNC